MNPLPEQNSLLGLLMDVFNDLTKEDFQQFKLHLTDTTLLRELGVIERKKLETEDRAKLLEAMMDSYGVYTKTITQRILQLMGLIKLVRQMSHWPYDPEAMIAECGNQLKSKLKSKLQILEEGPAKSGQNRLFDEHFTELYITLADTGRVNEEHEVRKLETTFRLPAREEKTVQCQDIFKGQSERGEPIRAVLTKGVAGVGKTVLTQKFSLDWAEGRAHQELQLLFPFTFRELNVLRDSQFSLVELLHRFFSPSKGLRGFQQLQVLFILDGLDECRLPLDFGRTRALTDPTESVSVDVLLVNLIRGDLLPSARLWITTRPAAADQIPEWCVSMVTEVRGFTDPQKEQYFRKRFTDDKIISHIKSVRSLHIMCHIPVFCWILSTVIQKLLEQTEEPELPRTLTQMYVHFLVVLLKQKNVKYDGKPATASTWPPENRKMVKSLGKLAFEQLQKGNLIFYECDLSECGMDAAVASVYSGVFTQVFREEQGLYQDKVYCFIHLSVQEFLAALHAHLTFFSSGQNLLKTPHSSGFKKKKKRRQIVTQEAFYRSAVKQALKSSNGHLDLFLRFLLGMSLPTNQRLLQGLLTQTGNDTTNEETVEYIKKKLDEEGLSAERRLNLLHCLNELHDLSLLQEIQKIMRKERLSDRDMSPADWSALCFLLLSSDSDLEEFDLRKYQASETALLNLLPMVNASTRAILSLCGLSRHCCGPLASVLTSSSLTLLDLSNNDLQDSGVMLLCEGLKSAPCRLETLRLSGCLVSERGGAALASALSSTHSHLRELDLSYNHPGPSAELLTALRDDPHCPLQSVRLDPAGEQFLVRGLRKYSCTFSLDPDSAHRRLLLSEDNRTVTFEKRDQTCPDHQDRFTDYLQVLSSSGLRGRCYWEVDWRGKSGFSVAVSHRGIRRRGGGPECGFGVNDQSWSLLINDGCYSVCHNNNQTELPSPPFSCHPEEEGVSSEEEGVSSEEEGVSSEEEGVSSEEEGVSSEEEGVSSEEEGVSSEEEGVSSEEEGVSSGEEGVSPEREGVSSEEEGVFSDRVAVFLDSEAGSFSFYQVLSNGELFPFHTFSCSSSEPLFPGFGLLDVGDSMSVVNITM